MNKNTIQIIEYFKEKMIAHGDYANSMKLLISLVHDKQFKNDFLLLIGRYNHLQNENNKGLVYETNYRIEYNKILHSTIYAIEKYIDFLTSNKSEEKFFNEKSKKIISTTPEIKNIKVEVNFEKQVFKILQNRHSYFLSSAFLNKNLHASAYKNVNFRYFYLLSIGLFLFLIVCILYQMTVEKALYAQLVYFTFIHFVFILLPTYFAELRIKHMIQSNPNEPKPEEWYYKNGIIEFTGKATTHFVSIAPFLVIALFFKANLNDLFLRTTFACAVYKIIYCFLMIYSLKNVKLVKSKIFTNMIDSFYWAGNLLWLFSLIFLFTFLINISTGHKDFIFLTLQVASIFFIAIFTKFGFDKQNASGNLNRVQEAIIVSSKPGSIKKLFLTDFDKFKEKYVQKGINLAIYGEAQLQIDFVKMENSLNSTITKRTISLSFLILLSVFVWNVFMTKLLEDFIWEPIIKPLILALATNFGIEIK